MPKKETPTESPQVLARRAVCAITGCGVPDADARLQRLGEETIRKIAELEASGRRSEVPAILNTAPAPTS